MSIGLGIGVQRPKQLRSIYSVDGKVPGFTADFIKNRYPGYTSLSSAINHVRNGNATMTDGYGPELVVNGGFDSDSDWTDESSSGASASIVDGIAVLQGNNSRLTQDITTEIGKTYFIDATVTGSGSVRRVLARDGSTDLLVIDFHSGETNGAFTATSTTTEIMLYSYGSGITKFDNVSVREMPVLKWAPHNLLTYSEDFSNSAWEKVTTTITANAAGAPDGTTTADKVTVNSASISYVRDFLQIDAHTHTFGIFAKAGTTSSIKVYVIEQGITSGTADIDLSDGTVSSVSAAWTGGVTATDVGNGWYFIEGTRTFTTSASNHGAGVAATGQNGLDFYIWGAHLYRSDLGGMADNPDQPPSRASYVPTTSSAVYLPRVGHHVYNGSAWVNEGLLAESEARTNLIDYSQDFTNAAWAKTNTATLALDSVGPDGRANSAVNLVDSGATGTGVVLLIDTVTVETSSTYTASVYAKKNGLSDILLYHGNFTTPSDGGYYFNLEDGTITAGGSSGTATIEEVGNGWYRCAITFTTDAADTSGAIRIYVTDGTNINVDLDGTSSVLIYGAQFEKGSTPSSLIPTSGSSVTRAAETFTIPSANLPWPSPVYIGSELVTNGTFDTDFTGWTDVSTGTGSIAVVSGQAQLTRVDLNNRGFISQALTVVSGAVYQLKITEVSGSAYVAVGNSPTGTTFLGQALATGENTFYFVPTDTSVYVNVRGVADGIQLIDNVSVREINPLSVSIAMDGRMTYADINAYSTVIHQRWYESGNDLLTFRIDTFGIQEGHLISQQNANGVADYATAQPANTAYAPDVLVPFDIASRYGSTFIQIKGEGRDGTANTTPTALPDLSSTDLELAYKFMGTIGTFRVWDKDIGDTGLVEATNPSLEPSLSLTFEGTGTNSFVVNDWAE